MKSFLSRLFKPTEPSGITALWHSVVGIARDPDWYAKDGVADTVEGRFDMVCAVCAVVLIRLEELEEPHAGVQLTELFITDMDGQLRESGVGDLMVGKHMGKLVAALGGRISAYREGLSQADDAVLAAAAERNVTLREGGDAAAVAARLRATATRIGAAPKAQLMNGEI